MTDPIDVPDIPDVPDGVPAPLPEGEVPDHGTPPTAADWDDGSADDALPTPDITAPNPDPTDPEEDA